MGKGDRKIFNLPHRLAGLGDLAYNLWWSRHPEARMLYKMLDRQIWNESTQTLRVQRIGIPEQYIEHGNQTQLRKELGIDSEGIAVSTSEVLLKERT